MAKVTTEYQRQIGSSNLCMKYEVGSRDGGSEIRLDHPLSQAGDSASITLQNLEVLNYGWVRQISQNTQSSVDCTMTQNGVHGVRASMNHTLRWLPISFQGEVNIEETDARLSCVSKYSMNNGYVTLSCSTSARTGPHIEASALAQIAVAAHLGYVCRAANTVNMSVACAVPAPSIYYVDTMSHP